MNNLRNTPFLRLLPDSLKQDPDAIAAAQALSSRQLFKEDFSKSLILFNPETLKERDIQLLDHLFRQEHVDVLSIDLTAEQKAELIYTSPSVHMKKGTAWAVQEVVSSVIAKAKVVEWFDYGGEPYMFQIEVEKSNSISGDLVRLREVIDTTKNLRSSLEHIVFIILKPNINAVYKSYSFPITYPETGTFEASGLATKVSDTLGLGMKFTATAVKYNRAGEIAAGEVFL